MDAKTPAASTTSTCIHKNPEPAGSRQVDFSIEHWSAQSTARERSLHWPDLLAVCDGTLDQSPICDKARGNRPLTVHPAREADTLEGRCRYLTDGTLILEGAAADVTALSLNHPRLLQNRAAVLSALLQQAQQADLTRLREHLSAWERHTPDGLRREYAGVALYILRRAIQQREGRSQRIRGGRTKPV